MNWRESNSGWAEACWERASAEFFNSAQDAHRQIAIAPKTIDFLSKPHSSFRDRPSQSAFPTAPAVRFALDDQHEPSPDYA